jgi:hypothetical protein
MKDLQSIIFKVMKHYDMIDIKPKTYEKTEESVDIDIFNMEFDSVKSVEVTTHKDDISMLIQSRVNITKTITMFEKQGIDTTNLKEKLENINTQIHKFFEEMDEEELTYEKYDQCIDIYSILKDNGMDGEIEKIKHRIDYLQSQLPSFGSNGMMNTKHQQVGINYEDPTKVNVILHKDDKKFAKLIKEIDEEYTDYNKQKDEFIQQQNDMRQRMIEISVCEVAELLDINDVESIVKNIQKHFRHNWFKIQDMDNIKNNIGKIVGRMPKIKKEQEINRLTDILCKIIASIYILVEKSDSYNIEELYKKNYRKDIFQEEKTDNYTGKNYKVIRGPRKGTIGTVIHQVRDYVLMTKDIYGKNIGTTVPSLQTFKIKKNDIKMIKCQYETTTYTHNKPIYNQLCTMAKEQDNDLFALAKYVTVCSTEEQQEAFDNFDALFSYALELYNKIKKEQLVVYNEYNHYASKIKGLQKELKNEEIDAEDYIMKQKEVKELKGKFIGLNKTIKGLDINKSNIFFTFNKSNITFKTQTETDDKLEYLIVKDTSAKYTKKKRAKKHTIYTKENKVMIIKKSQNKYNTYLEMLNEL